MDSAKTIAQMSEQEQIIDLLCGIPRNYERKVFLQLMMNKNATMTAMPDEIVTNLVEKEASIKRENGLAPEALLFAKKGGKSGNGGNGSKAGKGGKCPRRDKRGNQISWKYCLFLSVKFLLCCYKPSPSSHYSIWLN